MGLDTNVTDAIKVWFDYGINPGGWATALIVRDYEACIFNAHELVLPHLRDMLKWVDLYLPNEAKDMDNWKGWKYMSEDERKSIRLTQLMNMTLLDEIN